MAFAETYAEAARLGEAVCRQDGQREHHVGVGEARPGAASPDDAQSDVGQTKGMNEHKVKAGLLTSSALIAAEKGSLEHYYDRDRPKALRG